VLRRGGLGALIAATRRQLRLRALRRLDPADEYARWLERERRLPPAADHHDAPASFLVLVLTAGRSAADVEATRDSLRGAARAAHWTLQEVAPTDAFPRAATADWVTAVAAGDVFSPGALDRIRDAARGVERVALIYADEDILDARGRRVQPFCKPAWSPYLSLSLPGLFPGCPSFVASRLWKPIEQGSHGFRWVDQVLRAADADGHAVIHVPRPLLSRRARGTNGDPVLAEFPERLDAANRAAARRGIVARVVAGREEGVALLAPDDTAPLPTVSVLIPTRDRPDYIIPLGDALDAERALTPFEILFLDHETSDPDARRYLDQRAGRPGTKVLRFEGRFNFSRMINAAARVSAADVLLLLNNDMLPLEPGWLAKLARTACLPGVDAAGALLLYPDRSVQHAGIVLGIGVVAGHPGKRGPEHVPGAPIPTGALREASAATGACLAVRRAAFAAVGGMDERDLAVSFNDVDLCLKLRARGGATIVEPNVRLLHFETSTRDPQVDPRETAVMLSRWSGPLASDPFFHPALTRMTEEPHFELWSRVALTPRVSAVNAVPVSGRPAPGAEGGAHSSDAIE
jgi:GT2 family glycosyltransferase